MAALGNGSANLQGQHFPPAVNGGLNHGIQGGSVVNYGLSGVVNGVQVPNAHGGHLRNIALDQGVAQAVGQTAQHIGWGVNEQHNLIKLAEQTAKLVEADWQQKTQNVSPLSPPPLISTT